MIPKRLSEEIDFWINNHKYGSLQINFQDGKIVNINRVESIKVEMLMGMNNVGEVSVTSITSHPC